MKKVAAFFVVITLFYLSSCISNSRLPGVASPLIIDNCAIALCNTCNCYWSSECGSNQYCNYGSGCTHSGKLDGTCTANKTGTDLLVPEELQLVTEVFADWFDGYIDLVKSGKQGIPGRNMLSKIQTKKLPDEVHRDIRELTFNALDVLAGFDFIHPRGNCFAWDPRCLGQFRIPLDAEAVDLLEAGKQCMTKAILSNSTAHIEGQLATFWEKNPGFHPHHTGRCYPHGHPERPEDYPVLKCQTEELTALANYFLGSYVRK